MLKLFLLLLMGVVETTSANSNQPSSRIIVFVRCFQSVNEKYYRNVRGMARLRNIGGGRNQSIAFLLPRRPSVHSHPFWYALLFFSQWLFLSLSIFSLQSTSMVFLKSMKWLEAILVADSG
mmetsp:Transcript_26242/g.72053  ORF Transcript_26242/g.72053 Transcript_26242/m.72053 type:complete len:121 (+) Transcript_26242:5565-5927(+)